MTKNRPSFGIKWSKNRSILIFLSLLIATLLGFLFKFYRGHLAQEWLNNSGAAIWYEICWCLLFFWFFPTQKATFTIPLGVFGVTCILEFLQLWKTPILDLARSTLIGKLILGTTFSEWDFLYYAIGSFLGWLWLRRISVIVGAGLATR
jgi:hypothetical protein